MWFHKKRRLAHTGQPPTYIDVQYLEQLVKRSLGGAELTEEQRFVIKYHSYGCLGYTIEWLKGKLPVTAEELASYEFRTMPKLIRDAYTYNG